MNDLLGFAGLGGWLLYLLLLPLWTFPEGWLFHRAGYHPNRKICNRHTLYLNLVSAGIIFLLLCIPTKMGRTNNLWQSAPFLIWLSKILLLPAIGEFLLLRILNPSFSFSDIGKFFLKRAFIKAFYPFAIYIFAQIPFRRF
jgi:hypothetical protein